MNRGPSTIVVFAFLLVATPSGATTSSEIASQFEQCLRKGDNCIANLEAKVLAQSGCKAKHGGNTLTIHTQSKVVSFKDHHGEGYWTVEGAQRVPTVYNAYLGFLERLDYHLIARLFYEGYDFVLVSDASGEQFPMAAIPHASPTAKMLVSVSASEAYNWNGIEVWRVTPEGLTREFDYSPKEYALYNFLAWDGETKIRLEKYTISKKELCPNSHYMTVGEILQFDQGKWQLVAEPSTKVKCER